MKTHGEKDIAPLDHVFVFGSNLAGRHGAGAAKHAALHFGARFGDGVGWHGNSYAIPTKDHHLITLDKRIIHAHVRNFLQAAKLSPDCLFWLTRVGCGLAGYNDREIAPMFRGVTENVNVPKLWELYLRKAE
jgi:hypothetical protein